MVLAFSHRAALLERQRPLSKNWLPRRGRPSQPSQDGHGSRRRHWVLHAAFEIFVGGTEISFSIILTYLPVSLLYIGSMTLGYLGLRYIELSVSSPICNSSGALVAVMTLVFLGGEDYSPLAIFAVLLVCVGAIGLGVVDATEDPELRAAPSGRGQPQSTPRAFLLSRCRWPTACSTRRAPSRTTACSKRSTRAARTSPMS